MFVHLLITMLTVSLYGIAPVGFSQHETVDSVSTPIVLYCSLGSTSYSGGCIVIAMKLVPCVMSDPLNPVCLCI
jgi:hypothetical protein